MRLSGLQPGRGFTLLEVLVVVAIGAVLVGLVVLRFGDWRSPADPEWQLQRLAALVGAHCEQALFQSRPRGIRITEDGYDFWQSGSEGWVALAGGGIDRPRQWLGGAVVRLDLADHRVRLPQAGDGPQLVCEPLGELTQFRLELDADHTRARLVGDSRGGLSVERGQ